MKKGVQLLWLEFLICFTAGQAFGQDNLYMNDSRVIQANIIGIRNRSVVYRIPGDVSGRSVYVSSSRLDSLRYSDGRSLIFTRDEESPKLIKRNYIGVDLFETVLGYASDDGYGENRSRLHLSYERLSRTGETSLSAEILFRTKTSSDPIRWNGWSGNWIFLTDGWHFHYLPFNSFVKAGINYYPFNFSLAYSKAARVFCGISLLAGDVNKIDYSFYYHDPESVFIACLISNIDVRLYFNKQVQFKAGVDLSLIPFLVFIGPEVGLNISF